MSKNKLKLEFEGFDEALDRLKKLNGNVETTVNKALIESKEFVNVGIRQAMEKHNRTHRTINSLDVTSKPKWTGTEASIEIGFDIAHGGLASIFLMYGTPKMDKDQKLYNSIYGSKTLEEVKQIQKDIFYEAIGKL